jgi:hypothetical protein
MTVAVGRRPAPHHVAEAWYRQLVSQIYQARVYLVVYDRHVLFDTEVLDPKPRRRVGWLERIYGTVTRALHRPGLVLFLGRPGGAPSAEGEPTAD